MKKVLVLLITMAMFLCSHSAFAEEGATPVKINGEQKNLVSYNIKYNNYFKLRDIANVLKGTEAQFDVIWNESKQAVEILSGTAYSTDEEISSEVISNPMATASYVPIYKDGGMVLLTAYNIANNNYFKLRDIASLIGFSTEWNVDEAIVEIDTKLPYAYPDNDKFAVNSQYMSLIGRTKAEADAMFGQGEYYSEFALTDYGNGIMLGWGCLGELPTDDMTAVCIYISYDKLFYNCPEILWKDLIKSAFLAVYEDYNYMDEENCLIADYCGKVLSMPIDGEITKDNYAFLNIYTDYPYIEPEVIQITNTANVVIPAITDNISGYYKDDETGSYMTISYDGEKFFIDPYIVRNWAESAELIKIDDYTYEFYGGDTRWVLEFSEDYKNVKLDEPATSEYRMPDPYWHFVKE